MPSNTGTYDLSSLLAQRFVSAAEFGLETIQQVLAADLAAHNLIMSQMLGELCDVTADLQRIYGTSSDGEMIEVDEYGRAPTQRALPGASVGFPLRLFQFNVGWTRKWFETKTPADMAIAVQSAEMAHKRAIEREIKRALFMSANYTFSDILDKKVDLYVKRLVNADSAKIPNGPNGETYDGATHTHYTFEAGLTAANLKASIDTVVEHGFGNSVKTVISRTDEATVRALNGFVAYTDARIVVASTATSTVAKLDTTRLDNRAIGVFEGSEIWVKPWGVANYAFTYDAQSPAKTLAFRQRAAGTLQGLRIAAEIDTYPLQAQYMEAEFGVGVWTRTNGAIHYFNSGAAYADPTIASY
jgi:hypothetical protein